MRQIWKCLALIVLGLLLRQFELQIAFGLYLPLYFFVPILSLRLCTFKQSLTLTTLLSLGFIAMGDPLINQAFLVMHIFFIGFLYQRFERNVYTWTIAYSIIGFSICYFVLRYLINSSEIEIIHKVDLLSYWLTLMFISLFIDVLLLVIPQLPIFNKRDFLKIPVRLNQLIFMGINLVSITPLIFLTVNQSIALEQQMIESFYGRSENLKVVIEEQINRLDDTEIRRLELGSAIDRGRLLEVIDRHIGTQKEVVYMFNSDGQQFLRSSDSKRMEQLNEELSTGVVLTSVQNGTIWLSEDGMSPYNWHDGYYIHTFTVFNRPVQYYIQMSDYILSHMQTIYYYHILMMIVFMMSFLIGIYTEGLILKQVNAITRMADQIPRRMIYEQSIEIPKSRVLEVSLLVNRLVKVDKRLREMFAELSKTNRELNQKTSELNASRQELYHVAHHDSLTDLPNRRLFYHTLEKKIDREDAFALFFIDLNDFKLINDEYGHKEGDALLQSVAKRLVSLEVEFPVRFYRLAGDEFVAILKRDQHEDVSFFVKTLEKSFETPFFVNEEQQRITISVGQSLMPEDGTTFEELLHIADQAMYDDKRLFKSSE